jgi:hypothetical protein
MYRPPMVTLVVVDLAGLAIDGIVTDDDDVMVEPVARGQWRVQEQTEIVVTAPGFAARRFKLPRAVAPVRLTMLPESVIEGRVVEAQSEAPVVGALVSVARLFTGLPPLVTDGEGRYRIGGLGPGRYLVEAESARHDGQLALAVGVGERVEAPSLVVYERSMLGGRLLAADGTPGVHGIVRLNDLDHEFHRRSGWADKHGDVRLLMPRGHRFALEFECEQHVKGRRDAIVVDGRDLLGMEWRAQRGRVVHGRVIDQGRPVPGAMVVASGDESWSYATSGDDGSFFVGGLLGSKARIDVHVIADGVEHKGARMVSLVGPETREVTVELGTSLYDPPLGSGELDRWQRWCAHPRGKVVDGAGAPVAGAIVAYLAVRRPHELWELTEATVAPGLTGVDGSFDFEIDELRERDAFDGYTPMLVALRVGGGEAAAVYAPDAPVSLQLAPRGTIVARVRDGEGRPVRRVGLTFAPSSYETVELRAGETRSVELVLAPRARIHRDGYPAATSATPGSWLRCCLP